MTNKQVIAWSGRAALQGDLEATGEPRYNDWLFIGSKAPARFGEDWKPIQAGESFAVDAVVETVRAKGLIS